MRVQPAHVIKRHICEKVVPSALDRRRQTLLPGGLALDVHRVRS